MRKFLVLLWALNLALPLFRAAAPLPELVCAVCEADGHKLCETEQHECSHHKKKSQNSERSSMGHKCAQPSGASLLAEGMRYLPPVFDGISQTFKTDASDICKSAVPHAGFRPFIDHPPSA